MVGQIFRDAATSAAGKQQKLVDSLLEEAPILAALPVQASSHGLYNVYEELLDVDSASTVDLDEALPEVSAESRLKQVDMKVIGAIMTVGEDKAKQFGGAGNYFSRNSGPVLKKTGSNMERAMLYNTFRAQALANHALAAASDPHVIDAGGTGSANFSILAVHYSEGEVIGLYDEEGFGNGKVFDLKPVSNGALYKDTDGRLVYGLRMKTYFGLQTANKRYLSAIVNIDPAASKSATATMMDSLVEFCRGRPENTQIYMHPAMLTKLYELKGGLLQVYNTDNGVNRSFVSWNGVEIVTSYNFLRGTETKVTVGA